MPTTGMCPRGCASDGLDTAIRTRMRVAMIPTVLTCMFLSSLQPTEGAAERRSDRVRACLPHECLNEGLRIHQWLRETTAFRRWRKGAWGIAPTALCVLSTRLQYPVYFCA